MAQSDQNKLRPGDAVFFYHEPWYMWFGRIIQWITDGPAHVAIVHRVEGDTNYLVESKVIGGIQIKPYTTSYFANNKKIYFSIMRPPEGFVYNEGKTHEMIAFKKNRSYGWLNMIREIEFIDRCFRKLGIKRNREFYCSTCADEVYEIQDAYKPDNVYRSPEELLRKFVKLGWTHV
jgi:hypothetical protein